MSEDAAIYCNVNELPIEQAPVPNYTEEEHGTWSLLLATQEPLIAARGADEFITGLKTLQFPKDRIPLLRDVSRRIEAKTGWKLMRVDGLVEPKDFFSLLARKIFPVTDFIRQRSELMYTPAPDMFHDLFGHTPLLMDAGFTEFFEAFGKVAVEAYHKYPEGHQIYEMLPRIYWFTVEFGLINTPKGLRAYGSGSCSSPAELQFCLGDQSRKHPFKIDQVAARAYDIWKLQEDVFVIESFEQLGREFRDWAKRMSIIPRAA